MINKEINSDFYDKEVLKDGFEVGSGLIRISIGTLKGSDYLSIRKFYKSEDDWKATKQGITLNIEYLPELVSILSNINEEELG